MIPCVIILDTPNSLGGAVYAKFLEAAKTKSTIICTVRRAGLSTAYRMIKASRILSDADVPTHGRSFFDPVTQEVVELPPISCWPTLIEEDDIIEKNRGPECFFPTKQRFRSIPSTKPTKPFLSRRINDSRSGWIGDKLKRRKGR